MNEFGVFIGRFQPFHTAHLATVRFALQKVKNLLIVLGSDNQACTVKNPWTSADRTRMIRACLTPEENERVEFILAKDYLYNNMLWVAAVQESIDEVTGGSRDIKLIGHRKDDSSFYLKLFPQWGKHIESGVSIDVDASKIRDLLFQQDKVGIKELVPGPVYEFLCKWMDTAEFSRLLDEYRDVAGDKKAWEGSPYQPIFVTTDAVVICSGHVLMVRRGGKYGRGLLALPGGYIKANEHLVDSCIRELKEETGIKIPAAELKSLIVDQCVFDHPDRDLRGRVITHAFCIKLPDGELPRVKGMDDADKAWWMSLRDVFSSEPRFFGDHYHIVSRFVNRF
jgi:bifunctional NMN adenylyltransferase/nudix hydrolase